jgi:hypothetical protein
MAVGFWRACGIGDDDNLYCWGYGGDNWLGDSGNTTRPVPTRVQVP